ncbi:TorF family putative porin [Sphingomonas bacterium]|uniref:TorF family putative porin n=1 Tax=Sphingomonas bacterium TaxID=1895847 RepID=UPI00260FAA65|nr:TorF family putative porin [Sphingomonas bacterium]
MRFTHLLCGSLALAVASPAFAQETVGPPNTPTDAVGDTAPPPALKVTGGATLTSDYRFRGLTQTNEDPAIQGTVNLNHESGFYVGVWGSTIDGGSDGSTPALTNYGDVELDLYGGYTKNFASGVGVDVGLLYYYYPDGASGLNTDFFEPYASVTYTIGPVATKAGVAYAWGGQDGLDFTGGKDDNIYAFLDGSIGVPSTPLTLKAHVGYSNGSLGLANPTPLDDDYYDWSLTAELVHGPFKAGVSYVDTDITGRNVAGIGKFAKQLGRDATVLGYVGFSF